METSLSGRGAGLRGQLNLRGICSKVVMAAFRDMEEVSQGLLSLLGPNRAEAQQRRLLGRHEQMVERLLETQDGAEKWLRGEDLGGRGEGQPGSVSWERWPSQSRTSSLRAPLPLTYFPVQVSTVPSEPLFPLHEMGFRIAAGVCVLVAQ